MPPLMPRLPFNASLRSTSILFALLFPVATTTISHNHNKMSSSAANATYKTRPYAPRKPSSPFPYSKADLTPSDAGKDSSFYSIPRFVTHIDDNAIVALRGYYGSELPCTGRILDFCSSWVSHYPAHVAEGAVVLGTGMNAAELAHNPVLRAWCVQDLNLEPEVVMPSVPVPPSRSPDDTGGRTGGVESASTEKIDAATCVVSIDYLTRPVEVLTSIRRQTVRQGTIHLIVSNRCFPTKVVARWLSVSEEQRLEMVGDYLWWSGWREIEIVELVKGSWTKDPLWVVRAKNLDEENR